MDDRMNDWLVSLCMVKCLKLFADISSFTAKEHQAKGSLTWRF